ncbi:MAG: DUF4286 family protein [Planctomycetota bacterium]
MARIAYIVTATLPDEATAERYVQWLRRGHLDAVIRSGADRGSISRLIEPAEPIRVQTRYTFPTRYMYDRYLQMYAPALREEGMKLFGPESGASFERVIAEIL